MNKPSTVWVARSASLTAFLILLASLFLSHPYTGIRHDAILYAGDALARLKPGQLSQDLYFLFGSQGQYTILPAIYAFLIAQAGLGLGTQIGMLAAQLAYLGATIYFIRGFAPDRKWFYCCLSVVLGWTMYGGLRIFAYSEIFLTSRSFAEPVVLLSLGLVYRQRVIAAITVMLLAALIHPLIAATGFIMLWVVLSFDHRRWLWLAPIGLGLLGLLGLMQIGPFSDVFARYDPDWLTHVKEVNAHAFISHWSLFDFGIIVFDVVALYLLVSRVNNPRLSRFAVAAMLAGLGAMAVSYLFVDLGESVFWGKLQIWRTLWIMHWMAMASLPLTLLALWGRQENGRVAALLLTVGWMAPFSVAPGLVALMALVIDCWPSHIKVTRSLTRFLILATGLCAAIIVGQYEMSIFKSGDLLHRPAELIFSQIFAINILIMLLCIFLWWIAQRQLLLTLLISVGLVLIALSAWDQRSVWTRALESHPLSQQIWPGIVEPSAKVYWYRDLMAPWVLLGRGNYYTQQQGSGAVFSRGMVLELERRRKLTALLDFQEQICRMMNSLNEKQDSCEPTVEAVQEVCTEAKIDYIVLQSTLEAKQALASYATGIVENGYEKKFFLYRCAALTNG